LHGTRKAGVLIFGEQNGALRVLLPMPVFGSFWGIKVVFVENLECVVSILLAHGLMSNTKGELHLCTPIIYFEVLRIIVAKRLYYVFQGEPPFVHSNGPFLLIFLIYNIEDYTHSSNDI
jgi:hypothetical protein